MKTYNIITIGCQMNKSDSERFANYLENLSFSEVKSPEVADVVVMTTCGIRQSAEDRIYGLVPRIKKDNPDCKIILTGCLSDRKDVIRRLKEYVDIFLNIKDLHKLENKLGQLNVNDADEINACDYLRERPKYSSTVSAFVPIGNGCDNFCSYCVVPYARGREQYRDSEEIIEEVRVLLASGYKEITLIAQNVNSYHDDKGLDFADLLQKIDDLEGDFWLRYATSHPKDMSDKLINVMKSCNKLCHHLHLPAQSGDDRILQAMNRKYKISDYYKLIEKIRTAMPDISFSTDIIVGFPGESREQFNNTLELFKKVRYDMAYIAQFSPRPQTAASKMIDDVGRGEKKKREAELMEILRQTSMENNKLYLDKEYDVLVETKNKKGEWVGKNKYAKTVKIMNSDTFDLKNKICRVRIVDIQDLGLTGQIKEV